MIASLLFNFSASIVPKKLAIKVLVWICTMLRFLFIGLRKELHQYGYITYVPSFHPGIQSQVYFKSNKVDHSERQEAFKS